MTNKNWTPNHFVSFIKIFTEHEVTVEQNTDDGDKLISDLVDQGDSGAESNYS